MVLASKWAAGVYAAGETLTPLGWFGCVCILVGMIIGELRLWPRRSRS
ncbi:hypothetical protein [Ktedonobacter racemifer]|nr:hypothetical protein [Ktedonobacter racemifer]